MRMVIHISQGRSSLRDCRVYLSTGLQHVSQHHHSKRFYFIKEDKFRSTQQTGVRSFQSVAITRLPFIGSLPRRLPAFFPFAFTSSPSESQRAFYQWKAFGGWLVIIFAFRLLIPGVMALSALRRCVSTCGSCQRAAMTHVGSGECERMLTWLRSDGSLLKRWMYLRYIQSWVFEIELRLDSVHDENQFTFNIIKKILLNSILNLIKKRLFLILFCFLVDGSLADPNPTCSSRPLSAAQVDGQIQSKRSAVTLE